MDITVTLTARGGYSTMALAAGKYGEHRACVEVRIALVYGRARLMKTGKG